MRAILAATGCLGNRRCRGSATTVLATTATVGGRGDFGSGSGFRRWGFRFRSGRARARDKNHRSIRNPGEIRQPIYHLWGVRTSDKDIFGSNRREGCRGRRGWADLGVGEASDKQYPRADEHSSVLVSGEQQTKRSIAQLIPQIPLGRVPANLTTRRHKHRPSQYFRPAPKTQQTFLPSNPAFAQWSVCSVSAPTIYYSADSPRRPPEVPRPWPFFLCEAFHGTC